MKKIQIIGAPIDLGSELLGVDLGPNAIRHAGLKNILKSSGFTVLDCGNINIPLPSKITNQKLKYLKEILQANKILADIVYKNLTSGYLPITLGGDHTVILGSISAIKKHYEKNISLIWIDAHPDMNTSKTTLTGNIHGMPLSALIGEGDDKLTHFYDIYPKIKASEITIIGAKDIDPGEQMLIDKHKIKMYTINNIEEMGIAQITQNTINRLSDSQHLHISLDLDAIDVKDAPGVGMPNYGGLTYREILYLVKKIGELKNTKSIDLVELNPTRDLENKTAKLAVELILGILGKSYSSYQEYLEKNKF